MRKGNWKRERSRVGRQEEGRVGGEGGGRGWKLTAELLEWLKVLRISESSSFYDVCIV